MNRGLAKRAVFLGLPEIRYFQSRLAREVRRGEIEVHAFCFLTTHFHLLLLSCKGDLAGSMRRIENLFVRWFNRRQRRDGSLFRGRFTSRAVDSERYWKTVVRYIELNPVRAGLVDTPSAYPHGSAALRGRARVPAWFSHEPGAEIDSESNELSTHASWVVERRLEERVADDSLDDLVGATAGEVRKWMESKARLADGTLPRECLVSPDALEVALTRVRDAEGAWSVGPGSRATDAWRVLRAGMSRDAVGLSTTEAALILGRARSSVGHALLQHRQLLLSDECYADRATRVLRDALELTFGSGGRSGAG